MTAISRESPGPVAAPEATPPIAAPYSLFVCQPLKVDEQGRRWTVDGWAKDLALHLAVRDATHQDKLLRRALDEPRGPARPARADATGRMEGAG
jgi:hypothetical protein